MKPINILFSGLFLFVLLSCKQDYGKILEAQKQLMVAGVKGAPNHIRYTVKFEVYKPVSLNEVSVISNNKKIILEHFTVKDLKKGLIHSDLKQIPPGKYLLTSSITDTNLNRSTTDKVVFKIKIPEKDEIYTLSTSVKQGKTIFMP